MASAAASEAASAKAARAAGRHTWGKSMGQSLTTSTGRPRWSATFSHGWPAARRAAALATSRRSGGGAIMRDLRVRGAGKRVANVGAGG